MRISNITTTIWAFLERGMPLRTTYLQRRSLLLMRLGVCLALMANGLIIIGYIAGTTGINSVLNTIASTLIYGLSLALMLKGFNNLGRNIFAIAIIVMTWQVCLVISPESQTILFFLPISIGGTLLWSGQRGKQLAYALIAVSWYLISANTISTIYFNGQKLVSNPISPSLIVNMLVVFGATFLIAAANEETASNLQHMLLGELQRNQKLLADAMPFFVLNQLSADGSTTNPASPNASFVIIDIVNFGDFQLTLSGPDVTALSSEIQSRLSFFADQYRLTQVRTQGYAMVAIAKQTDLQDNHPDAAIQFAVAARNSLDSMATKQGGRLQFRIGIACTEIAAEKLSSVKQIQTEWAIALDQASRMEARVPINQIQINGEMRRLIRHPMVNTSIGDNYLVAGG